MKKTLKINAILSAVMVMVLCVSLIAGATFAWFTDTAKTGVCKIQAGKLDVEIQNRAANGGWSNAEGEELTFNGSLWEPGCTYQLEDFRVLNAGNLALKYKVLTNGFVGDKKLLEAIDFTVKAYICGEFSEDGTFDSTRSENSHNHEDCMLVYSMPISELENFEFGLIEPMQNGKTTFSSTNPSAGYRQIGASYTFVIEGHMKKEAGNEYQELSLEGLGITVLATQGGNDYDSDAEFPMVKPIDLTNEAVRAAYIKENFSSKYINDGEPMSGKVLVVSGNYQIGNQTLVQPTESFSTVLVQDAEITCGALAKSEAANTYVLINCNITLSGNALLEVGQFDQVCIGNVTVNGVKLTQDNYSQYINSQMVFFYDM